MKEGIQAIEIEPQVDFLIFLGPANDHSTNDNSQNLTGNIILNLNKAIKVKAMTVKFTGHTQAQHYIKSSDSHPQNTISLPILPKLKTRLVTKSTTFPIGNHILPWELEIPNFYTRTYFAEKRGSIKYQVELKISLGLNKKALVAVHPIVIQRHLIMSQALATSVHTSIYENTVNKFRYEIEAPSILCIGQGYMPLSIKFNKPVKYIYTQIIQTELYRCRNIAKFEADIAITAGKKNSATVGYSQTYTAVKTGDIGGLSKFYKRMQPVTLNTLDQQNQLLPLLLIHDISNCVLTPGIESTLITIYHQLEVTFNFGDQGHDDIRAKIPIIVSSVPESDDKTKKKYNVEKQDHILPLSADVIDTSKKKTTADEHTVSRGSSLADDDKSVLSDQSINFLKLSEEVKRLSVSISSASKPSSIDTSLASSLDPSFSITSPSTPHKTTLTEPSSVEDVVLTPPTDTFAGLLPPPRRARRKDTIGEDFYKRTTSSRSSSTTRSAPSLNSRPISPASLHHTPSDHSSLCETPPISPPPLSPPPSVPRNLRLSQSKSSCTNTPLDHPITRKRSNSTDEDYAKTIKSHYFGADLPPLPPAMTRQKLPSLPAIEKEEHRKTRMYYEDETDEEDEEEIYNFFMNQL